MAGKTVAYARRNAIALLALFVALGGTSYAVSNGGFTHSGGELVGCAKAKSGAIRLIRPGKSCRQTERTVTWNEQGKTGPQGIAGADGASPTSTAVAAGNAACPAGGAMFTAPDGKNTFACNGEKGDRGAVGPTLGGQAGGETPATPTTGIITNVTFLPESETMITTSTAGNLFVFGRVPRARLTCNQNSANCLGQVGLYVDGVPVPGSKEPLDLYNTCGTCSSSAVLDPAIESVSVFGLVTGLAPGQHTVQIGWDGFEPDNGCQAACTNTATLVDGGESQTGAILVGG